MADPKTKKQVIKTFDGIIQDPDAVAEDAPKKPYFEWKDEYNLGIEIVDKQHQKIVAVLNKLHDAVKSGKRDAKFVPEIIKELNNYIVEHFSTEEKLHAATAFTRLNDHKRQHQLFIDAVLKLEEDFAQTFVSIRAVMDFVKGWFLEHTQGSDRLFSEHILNQKKAPK